MTDRDEMTAILESWFDDGPDRFPDRSVDAVLSSVARTAQRPTMRLPRWRREQPGGGRLVLAVGLGLAAMIVVGGLLASVGRPTREDGVTIPSAAATSRPSDGPPATQVRGAVSGPGVDTTVGTIVFGLETGDGPALLTIRPDGSGLRELVPPSTCCAVLSPDGATVMFETDRDDDTLRTSPRWFASTPAFMPAGDRGGFSEVWQASDEPGSSDWPSGVTLRPAAWGNFDLAFEGTSSTDPSRDGIYLSIDNGGGMLIGLIVRMTGAPDGASDIPLAFSPDATRLLFIRDAGIDSELGRLGDLYVIETGAVTDPGAVYTTRYRPGPMRRLNPDGTLVLVSDLFGSGASWSPDGTQVAFSAFTRRGDTASSASRAYVADPATGAATPITSATTNMTSAHWSPDGSLIAFDVAASDASRRNVWVARPDGSEARAVASMSAGSCCAVWSPDSKWLLAQGVDGSHGGLFVIAADGSGTSQLVSVDDPYELRFYSWGGR